jgi:nicotinamidase-related amidase
MNLSLQENLLCDAAAGQLAVVDIQRRLATAMEEEERARVIRSAAILIQAAGLLGVPLIATEQYPKGLGPTEEGVAWHFPEELAVVEKSCFACTGEARFRDILRANQRRQVVLAGMETHVCVLQTALELRAEGYAVFVVEDGVCSRSGVNHRNALERMREAGVVITNTESVLFEWLRDARHEHFKHISALIK